MTAPAATAGWEPLLIQVGELPMAPEQLAPPGRLPGRVGVPANALILRGHGRTVLVDSGSGPFAGTWPGATDDLPGALAAAGCDASRIDLIVLTHLDFDHCGGVLTGRWPGVLRPAFPGVPVLVPAAALEGPELSEYETAAACVAVLREAGLIEPCADGAEPAPQLWLRAAPGHRSGHSCLQVGDGPGMLLHLADVVHHPLHVEHAEWDAAFDSLPDLALRTRRGWLEHASQSAATVVASHLPGAGRIRRGEEGLRWAPL
ncbi:MAG: MBL fold metallo-hydrolase [Gaiellales bacterium]